MKRTAQTRQERSGVQGVAQHQASGSDAATVKQTAIAVNLRADSAVAVAALLRDGKQAEALLLLAKFGLEIGLTPERLR